MKIFRLLAALALVAFGQLAHAGIVQSVRASISGGTGTATLNSVSTSDTLVLLAITENSAGSTFSATPAGFSNANFPAAFTSTVVTANGAIFYNQSPSSGTNSVTINLTAGGGGYMVLVEWSGMLSSALDVSPAASNVTNGSTAGSNSIASGTLAQANEVIFSVLAENTSGAGTSTGGLSAPPAGFIDLFTSSDSSGDFLYDFCYKVVSSTAGATASWTWTEVPA